MNNVNAAALGENLYDFSNEENSLKWKGVLIAALRRVLDQVHPSLEAREDALEYVETLCLRLLAMLCAKPSPHTVQDVENRVQSTFPTPIDQWALNEAHGALERGKVKKKSVLQLPVDKIHNLLQKELLLYKVDQTVSLFLVAVIEYISADILKLAGNYVKNIKHPTITYQDVQISMNADKALMDMFYQDEGGGAVLPNDSLLLSAAAPRTSLTYEEVVRELIQSEKAYIKELHMLIKVFREEIIRLSSDMSEVDTIFSNIMDIYELTYTLLGSLEDVIEMAQDQMSYIGSCFEDLAEAVEFNVYLKYAHDIAAPQCRATLSALLDRHSNALSTAGQGMHLALRYYLPALLTGPVRHFFTYLEYVTILRGLSTAPEDRETLKQVEALLGPLHVQLGQILPRTLVSGRGGAGGTPFLQVRVRRQAAMDKLHEIEKSVESWDPRDLGQCCNEFVREDTLHKITPGKRPTERRVFLFDGLLILCKPNARRQSSVHHQGHIEYKLKERFFIRKVEIHDHDDTDEYKHSFEIKPRQQLSVLLCAKDAEEKNSWMADLVMLNTRAMLERILDSILIDLDKKHPLRLPSPSIYKFAEPDSCDNIVVEERDNGAVTLIKGATLYKLIERLTYHRYADPKFVKTFLTTYRSFCSPRDLLDLLIERFNIPDPSLVYEVDNKVQKNNQREDWKKYRKEYCQPVQFRVLNVLRHWVDHDFYDFERDPVLLTKLEDFVHSVTTCKSMKKWVDVISKILLRKLELEPNSTKITRVAFINPPPPIEWYLVNGASDESEYSILTLHPVEIARQLTILEFDLYKAIKPSELVGSVWTKKDKEATSPNLLKMIKHTTNVTRWLEKNIVEAQNFEERVAIANRIIEIMIVLNDINNFNGVLSFISAFGSAAVYRLKFTLQALQAQNRKTMEDFRSDSHLQKYKEKLRSINPPCVPFLGMYLTNILHIEEGNPDFLPNNGQLINFFKRRKVAEITGEIQQYQNQPYCFAVEPKIRNYLENLNPFGDATDNEISNYLYNKSIEIEPRGCEQLEKWPRRWPNLSLKSPGIRAGGSGASGGSGGGGATARARQIVANAVSNAVNSAVAMNSGQVGANSTVSQRSDNDSRSEDSSKSDNEFSVFASVQLGTGGQNSPTLSPVSPAGAIGTWLQPTHSRSPSVSSTASNTTITQQQFQPATAQQQQSPQQQQQPAHRNAPPPPIPPAPSSATAAGTTRYSHHSQSSTGGSNSPGPHSPASPITGCGPFHGTSTYEPASPRFLNTPPPPPPPLPPRRRRDSPEITSPQQQQQRAYNSHGGSAIDAWRSTAEAAPPPLPPRREPGSSPGALAHHYNPHHSHPHGGGGGTAVAMVAASSSFFNLPSGGMGGGTLPRLDPTHMSQLLIRRHSAAMHHQPQHHGAGGGGARGGGAGGGMALHNHTNGGVGMPPPPPPTVSPRQDVGGVQTTPRLPPRPAARSADMVTGQMFNYPSTTTT